MFLIVMRPRTLIALSLQIGKQSCWLESAQALAANRQQTGESSRYPEPFASPDGRAEARTHSWAARARTTPAHVKTKNQIDHWWKNVFNFLVQAPLHDMLKNTPRATCFPKSYIAEAQSLMVTAAPSRTNAVCARREVLPLPKEQCRFRQESALSRLWEIPWAAALKALIQ